MIGKDTILVQDRGSYLYLAQKLGEKAKKVYYCMPDTRPYPETHLAQIGHDLSEIERIEDDDKWKILDKCDWACFFDCYDSQFQEFLKNKGYPVFGSNGSAKMELDRIYFLELLKELNMPVPKTYRAEGVEDMLKYLEKANGIKYIKGSKRGDFETKKFVSMLQIKPWVNWLKGRLGEMSEEIEILVQDEVKAECEIGADTFNLNGEYAEPILIGYEIKDKGYAGKIVDTAPPIIKKVLDKLSPTFKKLGCNGQFSTEFRITKEGKVYFTDSTNRVPSPPGHLMCEIYDDYPNMIRDMAHGKMPKSKPLFKYGVEIILHSDWHDKNELYVTFPKKFNKHVKLINHTKEGDGYYCIPNDNGGFFGGVIGMGNTLKEATEQAKSIFEEIEADDLTYDVSIFDSETEQIEAGKKHGIEL